MGNFLKIRPDLGAIVRVIIAISGRMASGKTTLARALADEFGGTAASFGDHVRAIAASQGRGSDREALQEIGQAAVDADPGRFVVDFLAGLEPTVGALLVLDGLRHVSVRNALCNHARESGTEIRFVHIETDEEQRAARLRARGDSARATASHEAHASEVDVRYRLRDEADLIVHRSEEMAELVGEIAIHLLAPQGISPRRP